MRSNPTREAVADIQALRTYLAKQGLENVPVYGVIVFTQDESRVRLMANNPVVPITHLHTLITNLRGNYLAKDRIDQQTIVAVVRSLYDQ
jgi:hypothetical protein